MGELDIDRRSDIYSLGVLGYYMLSGRLPFDAPTFAALAAKHVGEPPTSLDRIAVGAPRDLVFAVERCLRKDREERWTSARELADALVQRRNRWWPVARKT